MNFKIEGSYFTLEELLHHLSKGRSNHFKQAIIDAFAGLNAQLAAAQRERDEALAELNRRDAQEPVARILKPGPKFKGICELTQARTYAEFPKSEVDASNGYWGEGDPLYAAAGAAVLPPYMSMTYCLENDIGGEFMAGYNHAIEEAKELGCQPQKVVKLPLKVTTSNVPFAAHSWNAAIDECGKALEAAGVKWVEGE